MKIRNLLFFSCALLFITARTAPGQVAVARGDRPAVNFNPGISVVIDSALYGAGGGDPLMDELKNIRGFEPARGGFERGFNLDEIEIMFSADVDPYFKAWVVVEIEDDGADIEEAAIITTALPYGLQLKLGKFLSDFSRLNARHGHDWNFGDAPLAHHLIMGTGNWADVGVQLSWLTPAPFYLEAALEVFQGDNRISFPYLGEDPLPSRQDPRVFLGWLKASPNLYGPHAMQLGLFAGRGVRQDEYPLGDGAGTTYLDGHQWIYGADVVYRYTPPGSYGQGTLTVEGGYLARRKDVEVVDPGDPPSPLSPGESLVEEQDGLYLQGVYGFAPRWRFGLRGELVGLTNSRRDPLGFRENFDESRRATAMIDWTLTEFSRLRLQGSHGRYDLADGRENISEVFLQGIFTIGAHPAHRF